MFLEHFQSKIVARKIEATDEATATATAVNIGVSANAAKLYLVKVPGKLPLSKNFLCT